MYMKRFNRLFLPLLVGAFMWSCTDSMDLEPQASISDDIALSTPGNVQTALVGGYAALGDDNAYGGSFIFVTEIFAAPATELFFNGTFLEPREINAKQILTTNPYISGYWSNSYSIINRSNNILGALDVFGSDTGTRNRVEAEARFLRGTSYFNLVQVFGKAYNDGTPASNPGVPLVLTPTRTVDVSLQVPRASVAEIYTQVLADLTAARDALPASNSFFANTYVASAMLARVHLAMGNYAQAAAEANRVIASGRYSLFADIRSNYVRVENGSETIFAVQNTATTFNNDMAVFYAPTPYGRADVQVLDSHLQRYQAGDQRASLFIQTGRGRMTTKYHSDNTAIDPRRTNITVLRLAEMYLTRAEANQRTGGSVGDTPLNDVNRIRTRVGLSALNAVTLDDILRERRNELIFEGVLHMDLKRLQLNTMGLTTSVAWNANSLVFPIPNREMIVNAQLTQNPGY